MLGLSAVISALHLFGLAIGLPAIFMRWRALRGNLDEVGIWRVLTADAFWGVAALLWITTGPLRAFAGLEKGTQFYLRSELFEVKMTLFLAILALEIWPMATFIRWRIQLAKKKLPTTSKARLLANVSLAELLLVIATVITAAFMARGFGAGG